MLIDNNREKKKHDCCYVSKHIVICVNSIDNIVNNSGHNFCNFALRATSFERDPLAFKIKDTKTK